MVFRTLMLLHSVTSIQSPNIFVTLCSANSNCS